ncbi:MAG: cell surface protein, partial [Acidobacteriota bacterium]|nr:cell surface protein [Acidobacteriota bacterium]
MLRTLIHYRRINLAVPEESLLVEKALGKVAHTGGKRFDENSHAHRTLLRWLRAGAPDDPAKTPGLVKVELFPRAVVLNGKGTRQQMLVRARYADGTDRDVT